MKTEESSEKQDDSTEIEAPMEIEVDLRKPGLAALFAWLLPGAGHFYQRRYAKGSLFFVCILGTYIYGMFLGGGRVVYASWQPEDRRWQYALQLGVGAPAMPAMVQSLRIRSGKAPFFPIARRSHATLEIVTDVKDHQGNDVFDSFMAPPAPPLLLTEADVLAKWNEEYHAYFEIGTLFTMVAGLLNVLAIYDAFAGPVFPEPDEKK